jgi:hypothetical protein
MATFTTQEMKEAIQNWINGTSNPGKFRLSDMEPMHGGNVQCTLYCYQNAKRMEFHGYLPGTTTEISHHPETVIFGDCGFSDSFSRFKDLDDFKTKIPEYITRIDDANMAVMIKGTNDNVRVYLGLL